MWSHKACERLEYGRNPPHFLCHACDPTEGKTYPLPPIKFDPSDTAIVDAIVCATPDRGQLLAQIPEGALRESLARDLELRELPFRDTVEAYFLAFIGPLFDRTRDFWRAFVDGLSALLACERAALLLALDVLAAKLIYAPAPTRLFPALARPPPAAQYGHSESIAEFLAADAMPRLDRAPSAIALFPGPAGGVHTPVSIDDGAFIRDLPGFLEHTDEVRCENGIPRTCLTVTDTDIVVDLEGTAFPLARSIRRSFHFNCIVRLVRVAGEPRAALYATRTSGPLGDEKPRRGVAIAEGCELMLPFDGDIPFPIQRTEWKEKRRARQREAQPKARGEEARRRAPRVERKADEEEEGCELTLLSGWLYDDIPVLPIVVLSDDEAVGKYKAKAERLERIRQRKAKGAS
jgi:hypothetical protein